MSGHQAIRFARFAKKNKFDGLDADIWADWMPNFCPHCGAPMTDEAVDMVMERLEELRDEKG